MSKLSKEEGLRRWFRYFIKEMKKSLKSKRRYYPLEENISCLEMIEEMIQKTELTEEWREKKVENLVTLFCRFIEIGKENDKVSDDYIITKAKEVIRSIIEEIRGN